LFPKNGANYGISKENLKFQSEVEKKNKLNFWEDISDLIMPSENIRLTIIATINLLLAGTVIC